MIYTNLQFRACLLIPLAAFSVAAQINPMIGKPSSVALSPTTSGMLSVTPLVTPTVPAPTSEVAITGEAISPKRTLPVATNGYLIATARTITENSPDAVALTSLQSGQTKLFGFSLPGGGKIRLEAATVTTQADVVLAGSQEQANFIAILDTLGNVKSVQDTGSFVAMRVCSAPDGSIWTLGQDAAAEQAKKDYPMLQHRAVTGTTLGSYLARSSLHAGKAILNYHSQMPKSNFARLACGKQSVAAYVGTGTEGYVWSEVEYTSNIFYQTIVPRIPDTIMTGLYLTGPNIAYVGTPKGLFRLVTMDMPSIGQHISWWMYAGNGNDAADAIGTVLGSDSNALVHIRNLPAADVPAAAQNPTLTLTVNRTLLP